MFADAADFLAHLDFIDDGRASRGEGQHQHDVEEEEEEEEIEDEYDFLRKWEGYQKSEMSS